MFLGIPILNAAGSQRRKLQYLPPKIAIEGHGIKRGLTAVEAAILMEQPLDKVMTMILFGVVKKNAATVVTRDPLKLKVTSRCPKGCNEYEKDFLQAFRGDDLPDPPQGAAGDDGQAGQAVSEKMKGFSRRETIDYYKGIMERAWQQIEAAGTPEVKSQMYDENLEWTMLDKDYDDRTRRVFTGPVFVPIWWGRYDPTFTGHASPRAAAGSPSPRPRLGQHAVRPPACRARPSLPRWWRACRASPARCIGDVGAFTSRRHQPHQPARRRRPSSGCVGRWLGGGHSCACACACAGCACACAGGGR